MGSGHGQGSSTAFSFFKFSAALMLTPEPVIAQPSWSRKILVTGPDVDGFGGFGTFFEAIPIDCAWSLFGTNTIRSKIA